MWQWLSEQSTAAIGVLRGGHGAPASDRFENSCTDNPDGLRKWLRATWSASRCLDAVGVHTHSSNVEALLMGMDQGVARRAQPAYPAHEDCERSGFTVRAYRSMRGGSELMTADSMLQPEQEPEIEVQGISVEGFREDEVAGQAKLGAAAVEADEHETGGTWFQPSLPKLDRERQDLAANDDTDDADEEEVPSLTPRIFASECCRLSVPDASFALESIEKTAEQRSDSIGARRRWVITRHSRRVPLTSILPCKFLTYNQNTLLNKQKVQTLIESPEEGKKRKRKGSAEDTPDS